MTNRWGLISCEGRLRDPPWLLFSNLLLLILSLLQVLEQGASLSFFFFPVHALVVLANVVGHGYYLAVYLYPNGSSTAKS